MKIINNLIGGEKSPGQTAARGDVFNPATGEISGKVVLSTSSDIDRAVGVAKSAFGRWSEVTPLKRARVMFKYKRLIEQNAKEIAALISSEHGKTHQDALGEVQRGCEVVDFCCAIPDILTGKYSRNAGSGVDTFADRQPLGVVAGVTPFNFPAMVPMWMFPVAIACGNTFVLKPSERVPSTANLLHDLLLQAGLPPGVFNVVHGGKEAVDGLLKNSDVKALSFVGSTPVARYIYHQGSANDKRVQALGGAKNHMVIMPDANLNLVTDALMGAAYGSAGERCMAISVAVAVGEETADRLVKKLANAVSHIKIGLPDDESSEMGPLVTTQHRQKVLSYIDQGLSEGAELVVDGRNFKLSDHENGFFIGASLFDRVVPEMTIYREEIFGPVLSVVRAASYKEAVTLINNHEFGNGAAIFTESGAIARNFCQSVDIGMVGINVAIPVPVAYHSFGGWKSSLFGGSAIYGEEGVRFYTRLKTVTSRWGQVIDFGAQFNFPLLG